MCTRKGGDRVFGIPARRVICPTIQIFQCPLSGVWNLGTGHPDPSPISSLPEGRQQLLHPHLILFKCSDDHDVGGRRIKFVREGLAKNAGQSAVKEGSETFSDIALRGTLWSSRFETMEATPSDIFGSLGRMWSSPNKSMRLNRWVIFHRDTLQSDWVPIRFGDMSWSARKNFTTRLCISLDFDGYRAQKMKHF